MVASDDRALSAVLRASCVLSILGAAAVMAASSYPATKKKRIATQLMFWLSFADFCGAIVYFLASFEGDEDENTWTCQTTALLGIFFPVASFLWTDFIAIYLYTLIIWGKFRPEATWTRLMQLFHVASWGPALLCIILVGAFDKAGRAPDSKDNTGGWCWVHASSKGELFLWELIGGKFVEWTSALIILPYCYVMSARRLISLEESSRLYQDIGKGDETKTPLLADDMQLGSEADSPIRRSGALGAAAAPTISASAHATTGTPAGSVNSHMPVSSRFQPNVPPSPPRPRKRASSVRPTKQQGRVEFKSIYIKLVSSISTLRPLFIEITVYNILISIFSY